MTDKLRPVLAAEDEESDAMILRLVFQRAQLRHSLIIVQDGQEAVDYLSGKGQYADRSAHPLPALVLLDLKMPRMNGFDVLTWLAGQPHLIEIPAVVLSSSPDPSDIQKARELGARDYFVKAHDFGEFKNIVQQICAGWLGD